MTPTALSELQRQRALRITEAAAARLQHRGIATATSRAITATTNLLRAELSARRKGESKRPARPDMFEAAT